MKNSSQIGMVFKTAYLILSMLLLTACPPRHKSSPSGTPAASKENEVTIVDLWKAIEQEPLDFDRFLDLIENPKIKKDINTRNKKGETALLLAANKKKWFTAVELLKAGAHPILPDGDTVLTKYCSLETSWHYLDELLKIPSVKRIINARNKRKETALFIAVKNRSLMNLHYTPIKALLSAGADPNIPDQTGKTALSLIYKEAIEANKKLKQVANDFIQDKADQSLLTTALMFVTPVMNLVEDLLEAGAIPVLSDGDSILMKYSASGGSVSSLLKIPSVQKVINLQNKGETAFSLAFKAKDWVTMDYLVSYGAKDTTALCSPDTSVSEDLPSQSFRSGAYTSIDEARSYHTALMICSLSGHAGGVKKLLKNHNIATNINAENRKEETAFSLAVDGNHWEVMAELARNNANTDYLCSTDNIPDTISEEELSVQNKPYNILMICGLSGPIHGVNKLLENSLVKTYINEQNKNLETVFSLLMVKSGGNQMDETRWMVAKNLLQDGANPGLFPEKRAEEVQKAIADKFHYSYGTFLMYFSGWGGSDTVIKLLENPYVKASINTKYNITDPFSFLLPMTNETAEAVGTTALLLAVGNGHLETMNLLLQAGADPVLADSNGNTPLMIAADKGHTDIVKRLLEILSVKEKIDDRNEKGETAHFLAKKQANRTEIIQSLLTAGADPDIVPKGPGE